VDDIKSERRAASNRNQWAASRWNAWADKSESALWEIATKSRLGKLPGMAAVALEAEVAAQGFAPLPITLRHGQMAGALPGDHRDPFDRMLIAQAMAEGLALVSNETAFDFYGVRRVW
jgi:PIN domain nuclease of toxin-antitoxin system